MTAKTRSEQDLTVAKICAIAAQSAAAAPPLTDAQKRLLASALGGA